MQFKFCPQCSFPLDVNRGEASCPVGTKYCPACSYTHWESVLPQVAVVAPLRISGDGEKPAGVLVVKRKLGWCLPVTFLSGAVMPKEVAKDLVFDRAGLYVRITRLLTIGKKLTLYYEGEVTEEFPHPIAGAEMEAVGAYNPIQHRIVNLTKKDLLISDLSMVDHTKISRDFVNGEISKLGEAYEVP